MSGLRLSSSRVILICLAGLIVCLFGLCIVLDGMNARHYKESIRNEVADDLTHAALQLETHFLKTQDRFDRLAGLLNSGIDPASQDVEKVARHVLTDNSEILAIAMTVDGKPVKVWATQDVGIQPSDWSSASVSWPTMVSADRLEMVVPLLCCQQGTGRKASLSILMDPEQFFTAAMQSLPGISAREDIPSKALHFRILQVDESGLKPVLGWKTRFEEPQVLGFALGSAHWRLEAEPEGGWNAPVPDVLQFRLILMGLMLFFLIPATGVAILLIKRNYYAECLNKRDAEHMALAARFGLAMESANIGIFEMDEPHGSVIFDSRAARLHGLLAWQANETGLATWHGVLHQEWLGVIHPEDRGEMDAYLQRCIESDAPCQMIYRVMMVDGAVRRLRSVALRDRQSGRFRLTGLFFDITDDLALRDDLLAAKENTDIKNAELELALDELSVREQEFEDLSHRLELALVSYDCGVWEHDFATGVTIWDARMFHLYNLKPTRNRHVTEEQWLRHVPEEDRSLLLKASQKAEIENGKLDITHRVRLDDGSIRHVRSVGQIHTARDRRRKFIGVVFDVTADVRMTEQLKAAKVEADSRNVELELAKTRIEYNALHDSLTGLANRRKLDMELDALQSEQQFLPMGYTILHLDLDRFKEINDTLGHAAGDAMLVNAAQVLTRHVGSKHLVARIGGDEFVILMRSHIDTEATTALAKTIIHDMNLPVNYDGATCRYGVSIGIAEVKGVGDARKSLINADLALYEAKRKGRNGFEFFTPGLQSAASSSRRMADDLLSALEQDEIQTWYQPQFCAKTLELIGAEALIRWRHREHGLVNTLSFLRIADDLNITGRLDQVVLEQVLRDKMRWAAMGLHVPKVSVNVSSRRLHDDRLVETLERLSIRRGEIAFELVESIFLDESEEVATDNIERIKALGIDIEIDDFGTGHTSIISLLRLQPKRLKIDRQLVMPILNSGRERSLVRSIVDIARSLGIETVAEGVETIEHAAILNDLGCDVLQGYAYARPMPYDEFTAFALSGNQRKRAS
ncbi:EAL domain-containing protein [Allorhizobium sp. BGMRC 0089]|uniref:putative bifunctional diguanylate cyclase/phosphodiesterase n=1 Tax=Allorhizobium sonneratiae TaxID=2934936 RepID=UPI002033BC82|nr:GGDEF domain-containing phosphodiesterase [Allorhizobium sonneratiae]MCM2294517.1 EAL domain-containing protein [Allorhizobium sonneratiae]